MEILNNVLNLAEDSRTQLHILRYLNQLHNYNIFYPVNYLELMTL